MKTYKRVLTIAGSDSGGGAGIQADLKTFSALGCFGMSAITALTAQNTQAVTGIFAVDSEFVGLQLEAVFSDIGADAVKIGMLNSPEVIEMISDKLKVYDIKKIVLDPVMIAKSGDKLLQDEAIDALKTCLIPLAKIITPNIPEAEVLSDMKIETRKDMEAVAIELKKLGCEAVLIKGGHFENEESPDCLLTENGDFIWLESNRIESCNTHGTGCTLSSAIASFLAKECDIIQAVKNAKNYITNAIIAGAEYKIGNGHGPVKHFFDLWDK